MLKGIQKEIFSDICYIDSRTFPDKKYWFFCLYDGKRKVRQSDKRERTFSCTKRKKKKKKERKKKVKKESVVTSLTESFGAVRTCEWFFLVVEPLVRHKVRVANVTLATLWTPVWFRSSVNVQVTCQVTPLDERLCTYFTLEPLILLRKREFNTSLVITKD